MVRLRISVRDQRLPYLKGTVKHNDIRRNNIHRSAIRVFFEMGLELLHGKLFIHVMHILPLGKRKSGPVEDGSPDPNHPPVPTSGFAKYVGKLHKSDDRGFMIQYNVSVSFDFLWKQTTQARCLLLVKLSLT